MTASVHGWPTRRPAGRIAYVNGRYVPHGEAEVHVEDRGLQFADAIYEVWGISAGRLYDEEEHLDRLWRSVGEIGMAPPDPRGALKLVLQEVARRNRVKDGLIYLQVTRGVTRRDHAVPKTPPRPSLIITARRIDPRAGQTRHETGIAVITRPDERWARCDIKSTALLPNILAKTAARDAGAFEAFLYDRDGNVTEGASTSAWIVDRDGNLITRSLSNAVLPGVTRRVIMKVLAESQIKVQERLFTVDEARNAKQAFITAATLGATPVVTMDGKPVGDGKPGSLTKRIQELYREAAIEPVRRAG